jgi:hypothetical protein
VSASVLDRLQALQATGNRVEIDWVWTEAKSQYDLECESYPDSPHDPTDFFENALDLLESNYYRSPRSESARLERFLDDIDSSPEAKRLDR